MFCTTAINTSNTMRTPIGAGIRAEWSNVVET